MSNIPASYTTNPDDLPDDQIIVEAYTATRGVKLAYRQQGVWLTLSRNKLDARDVQGWRPLPRGGGKVLI